MAFNYDRYTADEMDPDKVEKLITYEGGETFVHFPIRFKMKKPLDAEGKPRDQTNDAAAHMRYAATLKLPELKIAATPRAGKAVIVGGAPSIANHLEEIRALSQDPDNAIFALNWSHTWLLDRGIVPDACVLFEIDAEPDTILKRADPQVVYLICSHCHPKTFNDLAHCPRLLWHSPPNSDPEIEAAKELFSGSTEIGGGIGTFTRTLSIAITMGFRNIELFGCDSSFPDDATSTHVEGYETANRVETDSLYVYAKKDNSKEVRRFKTVGYLALQVEEFKEYCRVNHHMFALRVHGDSLLRYVHELTYPWQYERNPIQVISRQV